MKIFGLVGLVEKLKEEAAGKEQQDDSNSAEMLLEYVDKITHLNNNLIDTCTLAEAQLARMEFSRQGTGNARPLAHITRQ